MDVLHSVNFCCHFYNGCGFVWSVMEVHHTVFSVSLGVLLVERLTSVLAI